MTNSFQMQRFVLGLDDLGTFRCIGTLKVDILDVHVYNLSIVFFLHCSSPVDMQSYELCCDMIDVVIDISCIYG